MIFRLQPPQSSPLTRRRTFESTSLPRPSWASALALLFVVSLLCACAGTRTYPSFLDQGSNSQELGFADSGWLPHDGPHLPQDGPGVEHDGPSVKHDGASLTPDGPKAVLDGPSPKPDQAIPCPGGCNDHNLCTTDSCQANACVHVLKICNDHDGCTTDTCKKTTGSCVFTPINCDDSDPCTIDSCKNNNCAYSKSSIIIYRSFNPTTLAHAFRKTPTPLPGFRAEAPVWRMLPTAGTHTTPVFQQYGHITGDYMLATSASAGVTCCGYVNESNLGYGLTQKVGKAIPVYRLYLGSRGIHLSSTSSKEGTQGGYVLEGTTFYACPY
ncbi:MAG: hypothetical protein KAI47_01760 [Deltaproteobacteria bacterium]|nr:hypothetical protein [Deltaproteobacteria bacterium]